MAAFSVALMCKTPQQTLNRSHQSVCRLSLFLTGRFRCFPPPITELEAKTVRGFDRKKMSYYVRLGSLSTKLRKRAYTSAVAKIQDGKQRSREFISELSSTVDLVGLLIH